MNDFTPLKDNLLIAMPTLNESFFERSVCYICEHNDQGTIGLVINNPLPVNLGEIFTQMDIPSQNHQANQQNVLLGGPVQREQGFVLHSLETENWRSTLATSEHLAITTSRDILEAIAHRHGPQSSLVSLGYAGWGTGQLESEIIKNCWLTAPATEDILFKLPYEARWQSALGSIGVDPMQLSSQIGHA